MCGAGAAMLPMMAGGMKAGGGLLGAFGNFFGMGQEAQGLRDQARLVESQAHLEARAFQEQAENERTMNRLRQGQATAAYAGSGIDPSAGGTPEQVANSMQAESIDTQATLNWSGDVVKTQARNEGNAMRRKASDMDKMKWVGLAADTVGAASGGMNSFMDAGGKFGSFSNPTFLKSQLWEPVGTAPSTMPKAGSLY